MHNTSNQSSNQPFAYFYTYIAKRLLNFFGEQRPLTAGDRYNFSFEENEEAEGFYTLLHNFASKEGLLQPFSYRHDSSGAVFESYTLSIGNVRLLIASSHQATESFMTLLRNLVAKQEEQFNGIALLVLYSNLDSLEGGSSSLGKSGMPLEFVTFADELKTKIDDSQFLDHEKWVLNACLDRELDSVTASDPSILQLHAIVEVIEKGKGITKQDSAKLGLFPHQELENVRDEKKAVRLIQDNFDLFEEIEFSVKHGSPAEDLDAKLSDKGLKELVKEIESGTWGEIDFSTVRAWQDKSKATPIEYLESAVSNGCEIWDRPKEGTKAQMRKRHIIVFAPNALYPIDIEFRFDTSLRNSQILKDKGLVKQGMLQAKGKHLKLVLNKPVFNNKAITFEYHDPEVSSNKFKFEVWCLPFASSLFKGADTRYLLHKDNRIIVNTDSVVELNEDAYQKEIVTVAAGDEYDLSREFGIQLHISEEEEEDLIPFSLKIGEDSINFYLQQEVELPKIIQGWEIWQKKVSQQKNFSFNYSQEKKALKLSFQNQEYLVRDEFRKTLILEYQMRTSDPHYAWEEDEEGSVQGLDLNISQELKDAFEEYKTAFDSLYSLSYLNAKHRAIGRKYITVFMDELAMLEDGKALTYDTQYDLIKLGTVYEKYGQYIVKTSPLHPLNVAYQLELYGNTDGHNLYEAIIQKLHPTNLLPYLHWESNEKQPEAMLYSAKENDHSVEWGYYSNDLYYKQLGGRLFIRGLVKEKLKDFASNFDHLFAFSDYAPLKVNAVNMGDCLQVLQGIFDYYKDCLNNKTSLKRLRPIEVFIYGSDKLVNKFEELSNIADIEKVKERFGLSTSSQNYELEDIVNALRENVHFYTHKSLEDPKYAHLTFFQFDQQQLKKSNTNISEMQSGISLDGLISDTPSYFDGKIYRTGFGTKYLESQNELIQLAHGYNALARVSFTPDIYNSDTAICTTVEQTIQESLEGFYRHSQWITFVDPRFDLSFFKNHKDLIIIHYSDQYSNTSGFDAITVTQKSTQYEFLLKKFLDKHNIKYEAQQLKAIINLFNTVNGEWLLKLLGDTRDEKYKAEKISLLAGIKGFLGLFDHKDVIWIPISLEEILRVSGGAGLKSSEGLFSAKNLGQYGVHSDDILMVALSSIDGQLHMQLYPVEVKFGKNPNNVIQKAKEQGVKTYSLLNSFLQYGAKSSEKEDPFLAKLYRNFFARLAVMSAEKFKLYEIWPAKDWDRVLEEYRGKLLSDDFIYSDFLSEYMGNYGVFSFSKESLMNKVVLEEGCKLVELMSDHAYQLLIDTVDDVKERYIDRPNAIHRKSLLIDKQIIGRMAEDGEQADDSFEVPTEENKPSSIGDEKAIEKPDLPEEVIRPMEILFGYDVNTGEPIKWLPTTTSQVMHTNTGIIGTMGTGKTQFTKSLITQLAVCEKRNNVDSLPIGILIFDYKGDYIKEDFVKATGAKVHELYHLPFNPLSIDLVENPRPLLPLHIASTLQETIAKAFNLGNKQKALLRDLIMDAYAGSGIDKRDKKTWGKIAPTITDVCKAYLEREDTSIDSLHAALTQLYDYEIFEPNGANAVSLYDLIDGVTVINLSGYSNEIQNLVVAITLDAFYSQMQKNGHSKIDGDYRQITKMVLVDEADNFLSKEFESLKRILKEGREFGVGTILSTQFLDHFSQGSNDYSQYILTWVVHKVNEVRTKDIDALFSASDKSAKERYIDLIKSLEKHHSIVNLAGKKEVVIEDKAFWQLEISDGKCK